MADDWIPCRVDIIDDPAVDSIARTLKSRPQDVVGCLVSVWGWAGKFTANGRLMGTLQKIDKLADAPGFGVAMVDAGWLRQDGEFLVFPRWERWNGRCGKARVQASKRQSRKRHADVTPMSRSERDKNVTTVQDRTVTGHDTKEDQNKNKRGARKPPAAVPTRFDAEHLNNDGFRRALEAFVSDRALRKDPITQNGLDILIRKCSKHPVGVCIEQIEKSIVGSYAGVFFDKLPQSNGRRPTPNSVPQVPQSVKAGAW